jgi:hypothetical protein
MCVVAAFSQPQVLQSLLLTYIVFCVIVATHPITNMHASALATSRPAAFLPHKQVVRQARRSSVKLMANFHSLSAKTLDGEAVLKRWQHCVNRMWLQLYS